VRSNAPTRTYLGLRDLRIIIGADFGHALHRLFLEDQAVLDRDSARVERCDDTRVRLRMNGDVGSVALGLLDRGRKFFGAVLRGEERVGEAGHAATCHELNLRRTPEQIVPHRAADFSHAVGDLGPSEVLGNTAALTTVKIGMAVIGGSEIPMPGGLRDGCTAGVNSRARENASVERLLNAKGVAAHVADRGEAGH